MSVTMKAATAALSHFEDASPLKLRTRSTAARYEQCVRRSEGEGAADGPLVVKTGEHTGRSAQDKFTVRRPETEKTVWWENNKAMAPEAFERLYADMLAYARHRELYTQ